MQFGQREQSSDGKTGRAEQITNSEGLPVPIRVEDRAIVKGKGSKIHIPTRHGGHYVNRCVCVSVFVLRRSPARQLFY